MGKIFIYVPSINIYVAKQKTHLGKNWFDCHKEFQKNKKKMLTVPEFIEFLKYLKSQPNNQEYQKIYREITEVRGPWRVELLDASFKVKNEKLYINYYHSFNERGYLIPKSSKILNKNTLMHDDSEGISLEDWLENPTKQGFPRKKIKPGEMYYRYPKDDNNSIVRFEASRWGVGLECDNSPHLKDLRIGARACKEKLK